MSSTLSLQPALRVGEYELVRQLGAGGMGDVWLATDTRAQRSVALKFVKPQLLSDPSFRTRFLNEARTLGRLEHDRIVTLYSVLEEGGHLGLVLRFIDGPSLASRIDDEGALSTDAVVACARDLLPALGFAHGRGIIHRDIKPQNVLMDAQGRAFLTDFGIAVGDVVQRSTMTGFAIGTPHYMSPEQIQSPGDLTPQKNGHRSDIYSFGVVLFEMLTGRVPFGAGLPSTDIYRVQHAHCVEPPPSLREANPRVSQAIDAVVLRCLAKRPDDRPQSCAELLAELEAAASSGPVVGVAPPAQRPGRAATIVEKVGSAAAYPSTAAPISRAEPLSKRPPARKVPWLPIGAAAIVLLVALVFWSQNGGPSQPAADPAPVPTVTAVPQPATTPTPGPRGAARPPASSAPDVGAPGARGVSPASSAPVPVPAAEISSPGAAARLVNEARALGDDDRWCLAKEKIDEAARLGPLDPIDLEFQRQAAAGCQIELGALE